MFSKILIANRGEIAVRIIRACKEMGISTVAVYSEADKEALHVQLADDSYCIGPASAAESYLNESRIIEAALLSGAQAIHPGYGFLSENAHFARECENNTTALSSVEEALEKAEEIGYPVMLKACEGGGGRGIRQINDKESLLREYPLASSESEAAFGDGSLYLEKFIYPARHIEVQILADEDGNVVALGERDCSLQYHHQKLIEETPSPGVNPEQREALLAACIKAVKKMEYVGVGTLEFLRDTEGNFWFMEMNVRLQVEHCVTEMLTRKDLVKWQIRTAAGVPLSFRQEELPFAGTAIECRINAASPGTLQILHVPGGPFVRFDTCLVQGLEVSPYYDSLLGKLIVYAGTREEALRKMKAALCELIIGGINTNIEDQLRLISDERFMTGDYDLRMTESR